MMGWGWPYGGWWMMGIGMLIWLVLIGLTVWLIVRATSARKQPSDSDSAEAELRRRFAAGEIDDQEYERRLAVLRK